MRIRDNVRSMLSTTAGLAGGGVALTGWLVKALTPSNASATAKAVTGLATGAVIAGTTYGALTFCTPATLTLLGVDISVYTSAVGSGVLALYTGACTSASYFLGGGLGGGGSAGVSGRRDASPKRIASQGAASELAKFDKIPNFLQ